MVTAPADILVEKNCKVLIIEPRRLAREGVCLVVRDFSYAIEETPTIKHYLTPAHAVCPDLVIWGWGVKFGVLSAGILEIRERFPVATGTAPICSARHVVLTDALSSKVLHELAALEVDAVLLTGISSDILQRSLELVILGQRFLPCAPGCSPRLKEPPELTAPTLLGPPEIEPLCARLGEVVLSSQESQILGELVKGASNKVIAHALRVTEEKVKIHVKSLLRKVNVTNRTQVAMWALRNPVWLTD